MAFIRDNEETLNQKRQLKPLQDKDETKQHGGELDNFISQKTLNSKTQRKLLSNIRIHSKSFNFIAILSAVIAALFVLITLMNSFILLKTWSAVQDGQQTLYDMLLKINLSVTSCDEYSSWSQNSSALLDCKMNDCPVCRTSDITATKNTSMITSNEVPHVPSNLVASGNITKQDPLSLLTELAQRGAKFTCDIICKEPLVVKSFLKVNSESLTWEGVGDGNFSAKQDAAFKALKELYPPHILSNLSYQKQIQSVSNCTEKPVQALNNSTKINRKC